MDTKIFADETYLAGADADIKRWVMEASPIAINRNLQQSEQYLGSPKQQVLRQFTNLLRNNGIEVAASNFAPAPKTAKLLAKVESAPIREIVDLTLLNSDNTLAETLGKMIAVKTGQQGSFRNGAQAVRKELAQLGLNTDGVHLADASGLSEENRITAQLGKEILQYIAKCTDESCAALLPALPIAKLDGTLRERFTNLPIGGKVRAKTGSLGSVTSMAGFLYTNSGRQLTFVIMIDTVPDGGAYALRPLVDHAIAQIIAL
ncbi:D-alanyl-D-alanine carboxypeptidase/D-alanyl-D-alanine endopeptidase [Arcanobacterium hippocoleae]|uniref:D-alanyl-D-alanine carboxypeptidase/D-alanyl-D-alanine endopeptidase n=1 Tax=Arcanobacterium hippocoleae TaxID=149017 RepID=UPI003340F458